MVNVGKYATHGSFVEKPPFGMIYLTFSKHRTSKSKASLVSQIFDSTETKREGDIYIPGTHMTLVLVEKRASNNLISFGL